MEPTIKLDQFLKLADVVQSGGEAKHLIQSGQVSVNGKVETRRGRKLHAGDVVTVEEEELVVDIQIDEYDERDERDERTERRERRERGE